jgi:hypothetical protein
VIWLEKIHQIQQKLLVRQIGYLETELCFGLDLSQLLVDLELGELSVVGTVADALQILELRHENRPVQYFGEVVGSDYSRFVLRQEIPGLHGGPIEIFCVLENGVKLLDRKLLTLWGLGTSLQVPR